MIRLGKIRISGGFLLLTAWIYYLDEQQIVPMVLLACAMHELGHIAAMSRCGISVKKINITAIGAEIISGSSYSYVGDGIVALAGPGVNLLVAFLFCRMRWGMMFAGLNLVLACFNLLPIGMLDGGRALKATLSLWINEDVAAAVCAVLDGCMIGMVLLIGGILLVRYGNGMLLFVGGWMLFASIRAKAGNGACLWGGKKVK